MIGGAISGLVGGAVGKWAVKGLSSWGINGINSPVLKSALFGGVVGSLSGGAGGFASGYGMSGFDFKEGLKAGKNGLIFGGAIGVVTGAYTGYKQAVRSHIDPWNGKSTNKTQNISQSNYNFSPDPDGDNVTLYRGTTGSETDGGPLFMTDNPDYAATYIKNGGQVIEATIPRSTLNQMYSDGVLNYAKGIHQSGGYHTEYIFNNSVKSTIVNHTKPFVL